MSPKIRNCLSLAAQQGERAALAIAALAGVDVDRTAPPPLLRAVLRTPRGPRYLQAPVGGGAGDVQVSRHPLWWPPTKVASAWLTPWLTSRDAHRTVSPEVTPPAAAEGAQRQETFRRLVDADGQGTAPRLVTFERSALGETGWHIGDPDRASAARATLANALSLLNDADRVIALAVHESALEATCLLIGAVHRGIRDRPEPAGLRRLERLASQAAEIAAELAAVREHATAPRDAPARRRGVQ